MNVFTFSMLVMTVLSTSGSAASALLWGVWGPPLFFIATALLAVAVAMLAELPKLFGMSLPGHSEFWATISLIGWGSFLWWVYAIPSIAVAVALRWLYERQISSRPNADLAAAASAPADSTPGTRPGVLS